MGVAIHTKEPGYYNELGSDLVPSIMRVLSEGGFDASNFADRVKLQSYHMPVRTHGETCTRSQPARVWRPSALHADVRAWRSVSASFFQGCVQSFE